jgi:hypothetical protein
MITSYNRYDIENYLPQLNERDKRRLMEARQYSDTYPLDLPLSIAELNYVPITLCIIVKNEGRYIAEWIAFHKMIGIDRFVFVLHNCTDDTEANLQRMKDSGYDVHWYSVNCADDIRPQMFAYCWMLEQYSRFCEWLMFMDADEFLIVCDHAPLLETLKNYDDVGGVAIHALHYGPNEHVVRPEGLVIDNYTHRAEDDSGWHCELNTIIRTKFAVTMLTPHLPISTKPVVREYGDSVDELFCGVPDKQSVGYRPATWDIFRCNHYITKSMEDWVARNYRGNADGGLKHDADGVYRRGSLKTFLDNSYCPVHDPCACYYSDAVKKALAEIF